MKYSVTKKNKNVFLRSFLFLAVLLFILLIFYVLSRYNYLIFHCFIEIFSVIISGSVFILSTFTYDREKNSFSLLGVGYLFVGMLDLLHTLSYQGMAIFEANQFYANQLWICARFIESVTILFFLIQTKQRLISFNIAVIVYTLCFASIILIIFYFKKFPVCYIQGQGQTNFKIFSEYVICLILGISLLLLNTSNRIENKQIKKYLSISMVTTILSELCFTLYTDNYGLLNVIGHLFKLISFYYIYKSILLVNVQNPLNIIFKELNEKEEKILTLLSELENEKNAALQASLTDGLTGIYNRRYFNEIILQIFNSAKREKEELSIIMIDIDFFKSYNDYYGHIRGDECLSKVANTLKNELNRATDIVARYGGEEFIVVLEKTNKAGALLIANKICAAVYELKIEHLKSECSKYVTISVGVISIFDIYSETVEAAISLADKALYQAKNNGRNRVEYYEPAV